MLPILLIIIFLFTFSEIIVHLTPFGTKTDWIIRCNYEFVEINLTDKISIVFNIMENIICFFNIKNDNKSCYVCICNITLRIEK
jgi:hypothetical protein